MEKSKKQKAATQTISKNGMSYPQNYDIIVKWMADALCGQTLEAIGLKTGRIVEVFQFDYRYGYAQGVRAMYAEAYPNWGEGPKLYIALKLQWNPNADVNKLLDEWYACAVGEEAASDLKAYYAFWEEFWTKKIKESKWFDHRGQYLPFMNPGYLDIVGFEDIAKSRDLLESVLKKAKTPKQQARAKIIFRAFEYYEASVTSYLGLVKNMRQPKQNRIFYENINHKRSTLIKEFEADPILIHPLPFNKRNYKSLNW